MLVRDSVEGPLERALSDGFLVGKQGRDRLGGDEGHREGHSGDFEGRVHTLAARLVIVRVDLGHLAKVNARQAPPARSRPPFPAASLQGRARVLDINSSCGRFVCFQPFTSLEPCVLVETHLYFELGSNSMLCCVLFCWYPFALGPSTRPQTHLACPQPPSKNQLFLRGASAAAIGDGVRDPDLSAGRAQRWWGVPAARLSGTERGDGSVCPYLRVIPLNVTDVVSVS